ncbi:ATP-binding cassette domain-containing protein [Streptomyces sp. WAC 00631]|uniref:ATP-binding cassette domain-containing protein n=1 Tax=unclassified Streptomyces TaxID=2593676 RepID=UPI000F79D165|nr:MULTISPECIES: ATP-binding cassette domain-containing protein [unclassified Streptomyces]MCC5036880.1 ATP-binding cassette domain-containing protein [Streptomyces sp. WAC 00631]MCC9737985.1 ATP-binding cassette domain-containing protein [Streptomyces sp. MNU89]
MIEVRGLTKRYGEILAVDDLTFTVRPGEVTGFLGPNGAGKSTTLRLILGLESADSGTATVGGRPHAAQPAPLRAVGALLDPGAVLPSRTAYHHVLALAAGNGIPRSRVDEVLDDVGLGNAGRRRAGAFSLGMRQRLGIAAALLGDPPVLIFDEPLNGLDPEGIVWIRHLMRRMAAEGRAVLMSSHLMSELELTTDHLIVVGRGRLIADMTMKAFIAAHSDREVLVRSPRAGSLRRALPAAATVREEGVDTLVVTGLDTAEIGALAAANDVELHELTSRRVSLEEAFMELTRDVQEYRAEREASR